jgi:hypothetical protein
MTGVFMIWGYLIFKGLMTWRVWFASLIAIAVRVILMLSLHYLGWLEWLWLENIPHLAAWQWLIFGGVFSLVVAWVLVVITNFVLGIDALSSVEWIKNFDGGPTYDLIRAFSPINLLLSF